MFAAQMLIDPLQCGINALAFYLSTIFQTYLGLNGTQARIVAASVFTFQMVCQELINPLSQI